MSKVNVNKEKWLRSWVERPGTFVVVRKELLGPVGKIDRGHSRQWVSQASMRTSPYTMIPTFLLLNVLFSIGAYWGIKCGGLGVFNPAGAPVLLAMCVCALFCVVVSASFALLLGILYLNPLLALSFQDTLPSLVKLSPDGMRILNTGRSWDRVFIPFDSIESVEILQLLYQGREDVDVLKLTLSSAPMQENWMSPGALSACSVLRQPVAYLDSKTLKMPPSEVDTIWLPLQILGSERDRKVLMAHLREHVDPAAFSEDFFESVNNDYTDSFTSMWFNELRSNSPGPRVLTAGTSIKSGMYTIAGNYGTGGFSVVYRAWYHDGVAESPQAVAVKEFLANTSGGQVSQEQSLRQILAEVTTLSKLDHPGIVKLRDHFAEKGRVYLVLEAIHGANLREYVSEHKPLAQLNVVALCLQMCKIISYLHSLSPPVFHRDLSPDNFMYAQGQVKLIDFNVATTDESAQSTVGKHCYMAAEQFRGDHSFASDLYQLGATMHYLCTGKDPEPLSPSDPSALRSDLSPAFCELVLKLTAYDAAQRPASVDVVYAELEKMCGVPTL